MTARRLLNISVRPGTPAHQAYYSRGQLSTRALSPDELAAGFPPHPELNLTFRGGRTIGDLVFMNRYVGGADSWNPGDISGIDNALARALTDNGLQTVIQQYYQAPVSSRMLASGVIPGPAPARVYKDHAEAMATQLYEDGALAGADLSSTVINLMLPQGIVLADGFSPGHHPAAGQEAEHRRREDAVVRIDDEAADSLHGLGGYHGSVHATAGGADTIIYYAIGVYSEGRNGIPAFDEPWKNVVATFYHELNEARTDPDVEEAVRTGNDSLLGWYSDQGGEIGDIPIDEAGSNLSLVFQEVELADGSGTVPVHLLWSNADADPAAHTP